MHQLWFCCSRGELRLRLIPATHWTMEIFLPACTETSSDLCAM
jgi:hypothetical protein